MSYVGLFGFVGMILFLTKKNITNPLQVISLCGSWLRTWANLQTLTQKEYMLEGSLRLELVAKQLLNSHGWRPSHRMCND